MKQFLTLEELKALRFTEIDEMQKRKFRAFIRYQIYPNSPFYRRLFKKHKVDPFNLREPTDWAKYKLPLVKKADYKANLREFVLNPKSSEEGEREPAEIVRNLLNYYKEADYQEERSYVFRRGLKAKLHIGGEKARKELLEHITHQYTPRFFWFSSGRASGLPSPVFLTHYDDDLMRANMANSGLMAIDPWIKDGFQLRAMNLFPFAPHLGFFGVDGGLLKMADFCVRTAAGGALTTDKLVQLAELFKVTGFAAMPGYLRNTYCRALQAMKPKLEKRGIILLAGERIYDTVIDDIKDYFAEVGMTETRVIGGWAASETKIGVACQCVEKGGYHNLSPLSFDIQLVKFTDGAGGYEFTSPEEGGYMVLFHVDGRGSMFEGYLMGDHVDRVIADKCEHCGLEMPRFFNISRDSEIGAQMQVMGVSEQKIKGATVNLTALRESILGLPEVDEVQIVVSKSTPDDPYSTDVLSMNVVLRKGSEATATKRNIQRITKAETEITPVVHFMDLETLLERAGGLKFQEIVDSRMRPA
jgi:phenylacetate-coenzyme A ligase PaaK-like adenylate-forming protein